MVNAILSRLKGIFFLDVNTYEEIEANEAMLVPGLVVAAVASILGGALTGMFAAIGNEDVSFIGSMIGGVFATLVGIAVFSVLVWLIGTKFFGAKTDFFEMVRVMSFSQAPIAVPFVGDVWALVTGFIGARQALDLDNIKTAIVIVLSIIPYMILMGLLT